MQTARALFTDIYIPVKHGVGFLEHFLSMKFHYNYHHNGMCMNLISKFYF